MVSFSVGITFVCGGVVVGQTPGRAVKQVPYRQIKKLLP